MLYILTLLLLAVVVTTNGQHFANLSAQLSRAAQLKPPIPQTPAAGIRGGFRINNPRDVYAKPSKPNVLGGGAPPPEWFDRPGRNYTVTALSYHGLRDLLDFEHDLAEMEMALTRLSIRHVQEEEIGANDFKTLRLPSRGNLRPRMLEDEEDQELSFFPTGWTSVATVNRDKNVKYSNNFKLRDPFDGSSVADLRFNTDPEHGVSKTSFHVYKGPIPDKGKSKK